MCTKKGTKEPNWAKSGLSQNLASRIFTHFCRRAVKCARDNFNCIILLIEFRKAIRKGTLNGVNLWQN